MRIDPPEAVVIALAVLLLLTVLLGRRQRLAPHTVLEEIFGETSKPTPGTGARVWALGVLHGAGVDAAADPVYAMKVLRGAEPRLTLEAARVLVHTLNHL